MVKKRRKAPPKAGKWTRRTEVQQRVIARLRSEIHIDPRTEYDDDPVGIAAVYLAMMGQLAADLIDGHALMDPYEIWHHNAEAILNSNHELKIEKYFGLDSGWVRRVIKEEVARCSQDSSRR